jgi:hypothetical protein
MQQFESGWRKSGSLVLSKEDLVIMKVQSKLESSKRQHQQHQQAQQDELDVLHNAKDTLDHQLEQRLKEVELDEYYQQIIQADFLQDGLDMAPPGDGTHEAGILKTMHRSELYDRVRAKLQQQNSDELMQVYKTLPLIKDESSEKEAKILSKLMKEDSLKRQRQELSEHCLKLQKEIIAKLEAANKDKLKLAYARLQGGTEEHDWELTKRKDLRKAGIGARSYSSRLLGVSVVKDETQHALKEEEEDCKEVESKPTSSSRTCTGTTRTTGKSQNPATPSRKPPASKNTTARRSRVTNCSQGTSPNKPSGRSTGTTSFALSTLTNKCESQVENELHGAKVNNEKHGGYTVRRDEYQISSRDNNKCGGNPRSTVPEILPLAPEIPPRAVRKIVLSPGGRQLGLAAARW